MELKQKILEAINNAVDNHPIQYGDRLYVVRRRLPNYSYGIRIDSSCPVCDGKKKINYKGYELDCTYCSKYKNGKTPRWKWVTDDFIDCLDKRIEAKK